MEHNRHSILRRVGKKAVVSLDIVSQHRQTRHLPDPTYELAVCGYRATAIFLYHRENDPDQLWIDGLYWLTLLGSSKIVVIVNELIHVPNEVVYAHGRQEIRTSRD